MAIIQHCRLDPQVDAKIFSAIASNTADFYSDIFETGGKTAGYFELTTSTFVAATNLVCEITLLGGVTADTSLMRPIPIDGTETMPLSASWETGLTLVSNVITFAATYESNGTYQIPIINVPPYIAARWNFTSGGSSTATVSLRFIGA